MRKLGTCSFFISKGKNNYARIYLCSCIVFNVGGFIRTAYKHIKYHIYQNFKQLSIVYDL